MEKAWQDFSKAVELDPRNADALNNRGSILWAKGDTKAAMEDFQQAVSIDRKHLPALKNLAAICLIMDLPDRAISLLNQAAKFAPKDGELQIGLGDAYTAKKKFDRAQFYYRKALGRASSADEKSLILVRSGLAWERNGNSSRAIQAYEKAVEFTQNVAEREKLTRALAELKARRR